MQSEREETLEERYAIKFCFKLGKMPQKNMEFFRLLFSHLAWIEHQFLSGIRDSRKARSLWGLMRVVGGVRKSIHQSWLAKGLGLGLLCWGFKGVQEEIPSEEVSTLQIGSVAFPAGQCTNPQLHPCHRLFIRYQVTFFKSFVWLDLGLNPGLPDHWRTLYPLGHWAVWISNSLTTILQSIVSTITPRGHSLGLVLSL